jgi:hypothetical protein
MFDEEKLEIAKKIEAKLKARFPFRGDMTSPVGELRPDEILAVIEVFEETKNETEHWFWD